MVKKVLLFLVLAIVVLIGILISIQYVEYRSNKDENKTFLTPRIRDIAVTIRQITEDSINANVRLQIVNPLFLGLKIDSITYQLMMDSVELVHDRYGKLIAVAGNDTGGIELPVTLFLKKLRAQIARCDRNGIDSASYEFTAVIYTKIPFFKKVNIHRKNLMPVFHLPEIEVQQLELNSVKTSGADVNLHLVIGNKNVFPIDLKDYHYHVEIGNHLKAEGLIAGGIHVPPKQHQEIVIPLQFSLGELGGSAWEYIKKGKDETYNLTLSFRLKENDSPFSNAPVQLHSEGNLRSLLKAKPDKKDK